LEWRLSPRGTTADDDLPVHLDAGVEQKPQPSQADCSPPVPEHPRPQLRVGRVDRDVEGRETLLHDALEVGLGEPGERREVAVEEGEPVVVVLQVKAPAHPLWQLVDEAELAVVVAGPHAVEHRRGDLGAERLARLLLDGHRKLQPAPRELEVEAGLVREELELDDVSGHLAVHRADLVARYQPGTRRRRGVGHGHHLG
jgi:hypothetical protein